jgi:hypothetical protein
MAKQRVNFSSYPADYYTGCQARIYFGSIFVDDVATIQYQTSHSKAPLYGYGDHQFRTITKGQFLVRGSFTVAFKETGYLYSILQLVKADKSGVQLVGKSKQSFDTYLNYIGTGMTVEQALDYTASKGTTNNVVGSNFNNKGDFEDISEVLEDAIWGKPGTPDNFSSRIPRSDELDYNKYTGGNGSTNDIDRDGFDILLTFGNYRTGSDSPEHTMISINDVHITGESLIVSPTAEPIGLTCEFFARGLNERISSSWDAATYKDIKDANQKMTDGIKVKDNTAKNTSNSSNSIQPINVEGLKNSVTDIINLLSEQIQTYIDNKASSSSIISIAKLAISSINRNIDVVRGSEEINIKNNIRTLWSELRGSLIGSDAVFSDVIIFNALKNLENLSK